MVSQTAGMDALGDEVMTEGVHLEQWRRIPTVSPKS